MIHLKALSDTIYTMKNVHIRLLYPKHAERDHVTAAHTGLCALKKFGVQVDVSEATRTGVKEVRHGAHIRRIVNSTRPIILPEKTMEMTFRDIIGNPHILGMGIVYATLDMSSNSGLLRSTGCTLPKNGGFLSLTELPELDEKLRLQAVASGMRHESGHLFRPGHCEDQNCIMHEKPKLSKNPVFCNTCEMEIQDEVNKLEI